MRRLAAGLALLLLSDPVQPQDKLTFWDRPRKGANCQNRSVGPAYWQAAARVGLEFVRLLPDAWPSAGRDFLLGSADDFRAIEERDLATLVRSLDEAEAAGVKVVLATISLPGARWRQLDRDRDDDRLWKDPRFHAQAESFWRQLAARLGAHPAIVAWNPLNEPHPERAFGFHEPDDPGFTDWLSGVKGTPADLNAFNRRLVSAIRSVDPDTPILLDGWFYASPAGLSLLEPIEAKSIFYAFHFYDPWDYTTFRVNEGRWTYPDRLPGPGGSTIRGGADMLRARVAPVVRWARDHGIPPGRVVAAEFGVDRRVGGAQQYLEDLVRVVNEHGWHWAFYAFRGDGDWTGLDYEIGTARVDPRIWDALKNGEDPERYKKRHDNPLWQVLKLEFTGRP